MVRGSRDGDASQPLSPMQRASEAWMPSGDFMEQGPVMEPAAPAHGGPSVGMMIGGLLRHKWLMLGVFLLIAGIGAPAVWMTVEPTYEATALVRVSPRAPMLIYETENNSTVPLYRAFLNTQVSTIRSLDVLERVLDVPEIRETHWYKEEGNRFMRDPVPPLDRLAEDLRVRPRENTELIEVQISTRKGKDAKLIVDTVVDMYEGYMKDRAFRQSEDTLDAVKKQHDRLLKEIDGLQEVKFALAQDSGLMNSEELRSTLTTQVLALESKCREVELELDKLIQRQEKKAAKEVSTPEAPAEAKDEEEGTDEVEEPQHFNAQDLEWRSLDKAHKDAMHRLKLAEGSYGTSHPTVVKAQLEVEHAARLLEDRERQLEEIWKLEDERRAREREQAVVLTTPEGTVPATAMPLEELIPERELERDRLKAYIKEERDRVDIVQKIARYEEQIASAKDEFERVRDRLVQLRTEQEAPGRIGREMYAFLPSSPDKDRRPVLTAMVLAAAFGVSFALGFVRMRLDSRIRERHQVQWLTQAPFLGTLPLLPKTLVPRELGGTADHLLLPSADGRQPAGTDGIAPLMERMRMVRTALLERVRGTNHQVLLVASPTLRAGKTSVALLLARSLAVIGKRVLLVEGDFYHPCLGDRLGTRTDSGLASILATGSPARGKIIPSSVANLDVMLAGDVPEEFSPEALANGVFCECVRRWRESYDFVILDSPPVLPVADARILASHADGTLFVVRSAYTRRDELEDAYHQMASSRSEVLGMIMIGDEPKTERYGYGTQYQYRYYGSIRPTVASLESDSPSSS